MNMNYRLPPFALKVVYRMHSQSSTLEQKVRRV